jgi:hypothetical protein
LGRPSRKVFAANENPVNAKGNKAMHETAEILRGKVEVQVREK